MRLKHKILYGVFITLILLSFYSFGQSSTTDQRDWFLVSAIGVTALLLVVVILKGNTENQKFIFIDELTGLPNRSLFEQVIAIEWNRNLRKLLPLSVILAAVDDFDAFRDLYGGTQSQKCLKATADIFNTTLQRAGDFSARYGANEFISILPDTTASEASFLAGKIKDAVEALGIEHGKSSTGKIVTVSLGTCTFVPCAEKEAAQLILLADEALVRAQNRGGNQVVSIDRSSD
jgi:diguanylate cyclase (GGDEF)-like protein